MFFVCDASDFFFFFFTTVNSELVGTWKASSHGCVRPSSPRSRRIPSNLCDVTHGSRRAPEPGLSWRRHGDRRPPRPPLATSPLLTSSRVTSLLHSTPGCADSRSPVCPDSAGLCLRANFPLSHRHVKAYPPCSSPLTSRPGSVNTSGRKSLSLRSRLFSLSGHSSPSVLLPSSLGAHGWDPCAASPPRQKQEVSLLSHQLRDGPADHCELKVNRISENFILLLFSSLGYHVELCFFN